MYDRGISQLKKTLYIGPCKRKAQHERLFFYFGRLLTISNLHNHLFRVWFHRVWSKAQSHVRRHLVQRKQLLLMSSDNSDDGVETSFGTDTTQDDDLDVLEGNYIKLIKESFKNDTSINKQGSVESSSNGATATVVTGDTQDTDDSLSAFGAFDDPDKIGDVLASLDDDIGLIGPDDDAGSVFTLPRLPTPVPQDDIQTDQFNLKMPALPRLPTPVPQDDIQTDRFNQKMSPKSSSNFPQINGTPVHNVADPTLRCFADIVQGEIAEEGLGVVRPCKKLRQTHPTPSPVHCGAESVEPSLPNPHKETGHDAKAPVCSTSRYPARDRQPPTPLYPAGLPQNGGAGEKRVKKRKSASIHLLPRKRQPSYSGAGPFIQYEPSLPPLEKANPTIHQETSFLEPTEVQKVYLASGKKRKRSPYPTPQGWVPTPSLRLKKFDDPEYRNNKRASGWVAFRIARGKYCEHPSDFLNWMLSSLGVDDTAFTRVHRNSGRTASIRQRSSSSGLTIGRESRPFQVVLAEDKREYNALTTGELILWDFVGKLAVGYIPNLCVELQIHNCKHFLREVGYSVFYDPTGDNQGMLEFFED